MSPSYDAVSTSNLLFDNIVKLQALGVSNVGLASHDTVPAKIVIAAHDIGMDAAASRHSDRSAQYGKKRCRLLPAFWTQAMTDKSSMVMSFRGAEVGDPQQSAPICAPISRIGL